MPAAKQSKTGSLARLYSRPGSQSSIGPRGFHHLSFQRKLEALLYVPEASAGKAVALAVILHVAGGNAHHGLELLQSYADQANLILLAPESPKASWDIISDAQYGPDVSFIDDCLAQVFAQYAVDEAHIALGGFSGGASYALSLGLSNGSLFRYIFAFSPGFMVPVRVEGATAYLSLARDAR